VPQAGDCESGGHERKRGRAGRRAHALPMQVPGQEMLGRADAPRLYEGGPRCQARACQLADIRGRLPCRAPGASSLNCERSWPMTLGTTADPRKHDCVMVRVRVGPVERCSSLYRLINFEDQVSLEPLRWRNSGMGCQAARRIVAPAGAKGWLRVSMYQIASASRRERSICATLGPRWRPWRRLSRW